MFGYEIIFSYSYKSNKQIKLVPNKNKDLKFIHILFNKNKFYGKIIKLNKILFIGKIIPLNKLILFTLFFRGVSNM